MAKRTEQQIRQKIFNRVLTFLIRQGKQAKSSDGSSCQYKADGSLKCAVGCLISDKYYSPNLEGRSIKINNGCTHNGCTHNEPVIDAVRKSLRVHISYETIDFLYALQQIHDGANMNCQDGPNNQEQFIKAMAELADREGLKFDQRLVDRAIRYHANEIARA